MPKLTRSLVLKKVEEGFPEPSFTQVVDILDTYGAEPHESERERVQLAVLKLSDGNINKLQELILTAKRDLRDVIAPAEYPGFSRIGFVGVDKLDKDGIRKLKESDLRQYLTWLLGT